MGFDGQGDLPPVHFELLFRSGYGSYPLELLGLQEGVKASPPNGPASVSGRLVRKMRVKVVQYDV